MKKRSLIAALISVAVVSSAIAVADSAMKVRTVIFDSALQSVPTEALIDRLQEESGEHVSPKPVPALLITFPPLDAPDRMGHRRQDPRSPVMLELIRRGVVVLPELLQHLTDARPTRITCHHIPMINDGGFWFADSYHPSAPGSPGALRVNHPVDFDTARSLAVGETYTVKVGDLCWTALGQIVNRHERVFGHVGNRIRSTSINSPVECPALAAAARSDWAGLTAAKHAALLENDAWANDAMRDEYWDVWYGAVQRLLYYYPDKGKRVVTALLRRTLVDNVTLVQISGRPLQRFERVTVHSQADLVKCLEPFDWPGLDEEISALVKRARLVKLSSDEGVRGW